MSRPQPPCKGCTERTQDCHRPGKCEKWEAFQKQSADYLKIKMEAKSAESDYDAVRSLGKSRAKIRRAQP